jgi:hypothetical protein
MRFSYLRDDAFASRPPALARLSQAWRQAFAARSSAFVLPEQIPSTVDTPPRPTLSDTSTSITGPAPTPWTWAFFLSVSALVMKAPDAFRVPQFWAEDGAVFFVQQWRHVAPQLFAPYAGYLVIIPRTIACIAKLLPVMYAPVIYVFCATLIGAAALASLRDMERIGMPFVLTVGIFALTPTNGEVVAVLTNVQWLLQFYLLAYLVRFATAPEQLHRTKGTIVMLAASLTGPFAIFACAALFALLVMRYFLASAGERSVRQTMRLVGTGEAVALFLGGTVQGATLAFAEPAKTQSSSLGLLTGIGSELHALQVHVLGAAVVSDRLFLGVFLGLLVTAFLLQIRRRPALTAFLAIVLFVALQFVAVAAKFENQPGILAPFVNGDRYFIAVKVVFWWSLAFCALTLVSRQLATGLVIAALIAISVLTDAPLRRPAMADLTWPRYAARIQAGEEFVAVPINPVPWSFGVAARKRNELW